MRDEALSLLPAVVRPTAEHLPPAPSHLLCPACFWVGLPQPRTPGSLVIESLLWALGVTSSMGLLLWAGQLSQLPFALPCLPGLGYSVWRRYRRCVACPRCGRHPLLPEEAVYSPACSHFLFSTEPGRAPDENRGWSSAGRDAVGLSRRVNVSSKQTKKPGRFTLSADDRGED